MNEQILSSRRAVTRRRALAAATALRRQGPGAKEPLRKYRRYRRLYRGPLPAASAWAQPYVSMMGDLMDELEISGGRPS